MRRAEPKTIAAGDDPWTLDRRLRTERDHHAAIVATRPPDRRRELEAARRRFGMAEYELHWATDGVAYRQSERNRLGPLTRLRRGGRADIARADQALADAHCRLDRATRDRHDASAAVAELERALTHRAGWDQAHGWRLDRITEIDDTLARHWADAALRAVRADDPLAFGTQRLHAARDVFEADLHRLLDGLPPDRRQALARAEGELRECEASLRDATLQAEQARAVLEQATTRRWGGRDRTAIERATGEVAAAEARLTRARDLRALARKRVTDEQRAVQAWTNAMNATRRQRVRVEGAVRDLQHGMAASDYHGAGLAPADPDLELAAAIDRAIDEVFARSPARNRSPVGRDARVPAVPEPGPGIELWWVTLPRRRSTFHIGGSPAPGGWRRCARIDRTRRLFGSPATRAEC